MKLVQALLVAPLITGALIGNIFAAADNKNDISYSVGYSMGKILQTQMKHAGISSESAETVNGFQDGILGKDAKLTSQQMQEAIEKLQKQISQTSKKKKLQKTTQDNKMTSAQGEQINSKNKDK